MLHVAICEDELHMLAELENRVANFISRQQIIADIACYTTGEQLLLAGKNYDLILMDIRLAGISGMEAARRIREYDSHCAIVFVTSSREDVFSAFDVSATHFLVKPVDEKTLSAVLEKAFQQIQQQDNRWLVLSKGQFVKKILFKDIIYCEAIGHNLVFVLTDGTKEPYYYSLAELRPTVDDRFFQCHRSYLINLSYVTEIKNDAAQMVNGDTVLVSRRKRKELSQRILAFLCREVLD